MSEVADVFRQYGEAYRAAHSLSLPQLKAMSAIENCRTAQLGGHVDGCDACNHLQISYNSCRNRHCPKCQNLTKERWVEDRKNDLLPIPYFHVVFTLPDDLNELALRNKKEMYALLLKASAETLQELSEDPKYLGAQIGFISILHTWGQNLMDHPHVHCIVTGGGLSADQTKWVASNPTFFLPVKVMSRLFRGKFLSYFRKSQLKHPWQGASSPVEFQKKVTILYNKEWVVYCKRPFKNTEHVLTYLGRYTHKVAIGNQRITNVSDGKVTFHWRDYKNNHQNKEMVLDTFEFIRRFLLHILPAGFIKIRHYGILSSRNKASKLKKSKKLLKIPEPITEVLKKKETWVEIVMRITQKDPTLCPSCKQGHMVIQQTLHPIFHPKAKFKKIS